MSSTRPAPGSISGRVQRAFSETVDPEAYVARQATDAILARLASWSDGAGVGPTVAALVARPGLGKTFLLRVFESRLGRASEAQTRAPRVLYLPYAGLSTTDLCLWVFGLIGRPIELPTGAKTNESESAEAALVALRGLGAGSRDPFILILDDADSMPQDTLRALVEGLPRENSSLRLLIALNDDTKASRLLATFDRLRPLSLSLGAPMSESETALYLEGRTRWAGLTDDEASRLTPAVLRKIHLLAGGIPLSVHRIAASIFEARGAGLPSELDEKDKRENWMGRPIEDEF